MLTTNQAGKTEHVLQPKSSKKGGGPTEGQLAHEGWELRLSFFRKDSEKPERMKP